MYIPPTVFLTCQGVNYEIERDGSFIWAPQKAKYNKPPFFYWETLSIMKAGDIILHSLQGNVVAVSEVMAQLTEEGWQGNATAPMPEELPNWQNIDGWLVKCEYVELSDYLPLGMFRDIIMQYKLDKYSAFDKYGYTNSGYCYILEPDIAKAIVKELLNQHVSLRKLDYLNDYAHKG